MDAAGTVCTNLRRCIIEIVGMRGGGIGISGEAGRQPQVRPDDGASAGLADIAQMRTGDPGGIGDRSRKGYPERIQNMGLRPLDDGLWYVVERRCHRKVGNGCRYLARHRMIRPLKYGHDQFSI